VEVPNQKLIRLVASRYRELQGLKTAGDGSTLLLFGVALRGAQAADRANIAHSYLFATAVVLMLTLIGAWLFLRRRLDRYYDFRFGRVGARTFVYPYALLFLICTGWMAMWCDIPGPIWVTAPLAHVASIPLIAGPGMAAKRGAPYRLPWVLVAMAALVAALQLPLGDASARLIWRMHSLVYGGGTLVVAGLCDHLLLVRTLKPTPNSDASERA
jgi:hypothetical protein